MPFARAVHAGRSSPVVAGEQLASPAGAPQGPPGWTSALSRQEGTAAAALPRPGRASL